MLDWNDLHPYNAVHVLEVSTALDFEKLTKVIEQSLEFHGLTHLTLDRKKSCRFAGGFSPCEIVRIEATENPHELLRAEIERQINTAFDSSHTFLPFRFFVVAKKASFHLGLVYFHAIADAVSIVHLLRHIYENYRNDGKISDPKPFGRARTETRFHPLALTRKTGAFLKQLREHQHSVRVAQRNFSHANRFECFSLGPETLRALSESAKNWEVTINDIFLAVLLMCCSPFARNRFQQSRRRRVTVGCIANTRSDLRLENPQAWGLFLGSFVVSHEIPENVRLAELARDLRRQTLAIKRRKNHVGASPERFFGRLLLSFFSTEYRAKLYQKHYPLWGGLTNMNLNLLWPQPEGGPAVDFFRGVSTGPVTPLVLSVTTARNVVNIGMTFRTATFTEEHIVQIKKNFLKILGQLNPRA